jgi:inner membrane protein
VVIAAKSKKQRYVYWAIVWLCVYVSFGVVQHHRALKAGNALVAERHQQMIRLEVKPSFGNLLVWKIVYETDLHFYVDAIKLGFFESKFWPGSHVNKLDIDRDLPWLDKSSQQAQDIERFRWFSSGFISKDPNNPYQVVDMRYSALPNEVKPLWGIRLSPEASAKQHAEFYTDSIKSSRGFDVLWQMVVE